VVTQDILLRRAGVVVGKLRDTDSGELINDNNKHRFLTDGFQIRAEADPWVPGGFAQGERNRCGGTGLSISTVTGRFTIARLLPGQTYDIFLEGFGDFGSSAGALGKRAYTPLTLSGIQVTEGQELDLGTLNLRGGSSLSGRVVDEGGNPLPNIRVQAYPSLKNDAQNLGIFAMTDEEGRYVLEGVARDIPYYDVVAAPRPRVGETQGGAEGLLELPYGEERKRMVDTRASPSVDFRLVKADAVLLGRVVPLSQGPSLRLPHSSGGFAEERAFLKLQRHGQLSDDPTGEIEDVTALDGNFRVDNLPPGGYTLRIFSIGYITVRQVVILKSGVTNVGDILLEKGASLAGTLTKPDLSSPSLREIDQLFGVDEDVQEFVSADLDKDKPTSTVTGYRIDGFKPGVVYSLLAISVDGDVVEISTGISFSSAGEKKTMNAVYRPSAPSVFVTQNLVGNTLTATFYSTHQLRNLTNDDKDLNKILTKIFGNGTWTFDLSSSRDRLTATYVFPPNETSCKVRFSFVSIHEDAGSSTGAHFTFSEEFQFFRGVSRQRRSTMLNAKGGTVQMEGELTNIFCPPGTFQGEKIIRSTRVDVGIRTASSLGSFTGGVGAPLGVAAAALQLGPSAYPSSELYKAVSLASGIDPFSAFYDIFLPAGVSHSLKAEAFITLPYTGSVDPSKLNMYYFDEKNGVYLLENSRRTIDTTNKTITVGVRHFSTFVVLNAQTAIVGTNNFTGKEILVYNFPNPFDLNTKAVTLANTTSSSSLNIDGTVIKCALPLGNSGTLKIEIYNVAGELVRTLTELAPTGGTYYYIPWDGKNDSGQKVASGVYVARLTLNGGDEKFFKMAVIK
jgi:hypothetical protein